MRPGRPSIPALLLFVLAACSVANAAEHPAAGAQAHLREGNAAYREGDYLAFAEAYEAALALNPASLYTRYNLAAAYALTGRADAALDLLDGLAAVGADYRPAADERFDVLADTPRFRAMVGRLAAEARPLANSEPHFVVDQLGLVPEGIAVDAASGRLFFGSMRTGDVYVLDRDDRYSKFASLGEPGLAAIGMTVQPSAGLLWVVGSTFFMAEGYDAEAPARGGVVAFDLDTGQAVHRHLEEGVEFANDVTVAPDGRLYVSAGGIRVLDGVGGGRLKVLETSSPLYGANGLVVGSGGNALYVACYPVGLARIELASGRVDWLDAPEDVSLYGIDGLYLYEGDLVAVQNGVPPWRILRLTLAPDGTSVASARVLDRGDPAATGMTGAITGNRLHWVGQAPSPEPPPAHFPDVLEDSAGAIVIMSTPLD